MIPSKVEYHKPQNIDEAIQLLHNFGDDCKILAGGHSLIPIMKLRLNDPENLIDISEIESLKGISDNEKSVTIGAACTHGEIAKNAAIQQHAPMISKAAGMIGDVQVRNFGTIGGSIAHADPAADWPAVLLASNATVVIRNADGTREKDIDQFFQGIFTTALEDGEIITSIRIPKTDFNTNSNYEKFSQPASRFALVGCAAAVSLENGVVNTARVAFNGVSGKPFRDTGIENALTGKPLNSETIVAAVANAADGISILSDHYASEKYRKHLAGVFAKRTLSELM
jgi:aerobic carbon-monoxide dehydrogenase medium subunit